MLIIEGGFINMKSVKSAASCQSGLTFWSNLNGQPSLRLFGFENRARMDASCW